MAKPVGRTRGLRSACDRCYQLKERCERLSATSSCERCKKLDQVCSSVRPVRPTGRPTGRRTYGRENIISWLQESHDLSLAERELLTFLLGDTRVPLCSVVTPRFKDAEQQSLAGHLPAAWPILKDAYIAYAGVMKSLLTSLNPADNDSNIRHAALAMRALRSLRVSKPKDAELCLTLGFALAISAYAAVGVGITDICNYCLSITRPFIETAVLDPGLEPRITFLVLLETMECLVYRRKPTLRIQSRASGSVDRHLGLSLPLLSYYYDICTISHLLSNCTDTKSVTLLQQQLEDIKGQMYHWQPSHPEEFVHEYSTADVIQLLAQARVYRLGGLLMIHRLQHTFGQEDSQADIWSNEVMMELELSRRISKQPVRFVTLPFIIAAVEIRDPVKRSKAVQDVDDYVDQFTPVVRKATKIFFSRVWNERDELTYCSWFDSVHKPCVVMDSIAKSLSRHDAT